MNAVIKFKYLLALSLILLNSFIFKFLVKYGTHIPSIDEIITDTIKLRLNTIPYIAVSVLLLIDVIMVLSDCDKIVKARPCTTNGKETLIAYFR